MVKLILLNWWVGLIVWERGGNPRRRTMTQQAKSVLSQLKQSIERLNLAKNDPAQLTQVIQEIQQQLTQVERQLDQDR